MTSSLARTRNAVARGCIACVALAGSLVAQSTDSSTSTPASPGQSQTLTAPPLSVAGKFDYRIVRSLTFRGLLGTAFGAAVAQSQNVPKEWGGGAGAFGERFASVLGTDLSRQTMAFTMETVLREDPRYFPSSEKNFGRRMKYVLIETATTRTDSGKRRFATSRFVSAFAAGQLTNAWQPASNNTVGDGLIRGAILLAGDLSYNFIQEFIPFTRPKALKH